MKSKSVTGRKMFSEYIYMVGVDLAAFLLVTDTLGIAAGTASFALLAPLAAVVVGYAIYTTIRVTLFLGLEDAAYDNQGGDDSEKQFTLGWLRWMGERIDVVRKKFAPAGTLVGGKK